MLSHLLQDYINNLLFLSDINSSFKEEAISMCLYSIGVFPNNEAFYQNLAYLDESL